MPTQQEQAIADQFKIPEASTEPRQLKQFDCEIYLTNRILTIITVSAYNEEEAIVVAARNFKIKPKLLKQKYGEQ